MEQNLQTAIDLINKNDLLSADAKAIIIARLQVANEQIAIAEFKLDNIEKVKRTTAILLEKTIEELGQKSKAVEAQNRELEIEVILERVRSRGMAMQKSEEFKEVIQVVYDQFVHLNINVEHAGFILDYKERDDMHIWLADKHEVPSEITLPYFNSPHWNSFIEAKENGKNLFTNHLSFEEKNKFYRQLFTLFPLPDDAKTYYFNCAGLAISTVLLDNVGLYIENFSGTPYTDQENNILMRVGKVFQQTHTRFSDLQKAEKQTRKAQIELALERVRAKTMAMYQSTELADTATILFQQIKGLGFETWSCGFCIWQKNDLAEVWMGADSGGLLPPMMIPYKKEPTHQDIYKASLTAADSHEKIWEGKALNKHYDFLRTLPSVAVAIKQLEDAGLSLPAKQCYYVGFFKQGYLLLITKEPNAEMQDISKRFAKVFEQAYTRFLDLQKAEAQAKEAQIETALERVRSRTMAMQHSDELADASFVLDSQVRALGIQTRGCAFNIYEENASTEWFSSGMGAMPAYKTPREALFLRYYEAGKKGEQIHIEKYEGAVCAAHYEYLCSLPGIGDGLNAMIAAGGSLPSHQIDHAVYFKYGYLLFITADEVPEAHDIFKRFAKVFEQTYTRFLDLQKAEAQAKEATIEAALEKIRSRSLAMHRSDELKEVMTVMFEKMTELDVLLGTIAIQIFDEETKSSDFWVGNDLQNPALVKLPYDEKIAGEDVYIKQFWEAKTTGKNIINKVDTVEQIKKYFSYVFANNDERVIPLAVREFIRQAQQHAYCLIIENNSALFADSWDG
ncbi:MAG: hypothetical protein ABIT58_03225, partial [Ferruginibacter sp.]